MLAVVSLAAGLVLARVPHASGLRLEQAARRLAERLSDARQRAILLGRPVRVDVADGLPPAVWLETLDVGGTATRTLELGADGDALPARAILADGSGRRLLVLLPAGFHRARVLEEAAP